MTRGTRIPLHALSRSSRLAGLISSIRSQGVVLEAKRRREERRTLADFAVEFLTALYGRTPDARLSLEELTRRCFGNLQSESKNAVRTAVRRLRLHEPDKALYKDPGTGRYILPGRHCIAPTRRIVARLSASSTGMRISRDNVATKIPDGHTIARAVDAGVACRRVKLREIPIVA